MSRSKTERWEAAQSYEKEWWDSRKDQIDCRFYEAYAHELLEQLEGILEIEKHTPILEIGTGAAGIITFLQSNQRYGIDPLEDFYSSVENFKKSRDPHVKYQAAKAEELPFEDNKFQLLIIDNVLDHCDDIEMVFKEMRRVLQPNGKVYLRLNVYTYWGKVVRLLVAKLKIDPGHPYTFARRSILSLFKNHDFKILKTEEQGYWKTWFREIRSGKLKELLKAVTISSPNKTAYILEKK
jgi:ubiquinone/menaquinone biosynthesis C-methylase UbiE